MARYHEGVNQDGTGGTNTTRKRGKYDGGISRQHGILKKSHLRDMAPPRPGPCPQGTCSTGRQCGIRPLCRPVYDHTKSCLREALRQRYTIPLGHLLFSLIQGYSRQPCSHGWPGCFATLLPGRAPSPRWTVPPQASPMGTSCSRSSLKTVAIPTFSYLPQTANPSRDDTTLSAHSEHVLLPGMYNVKKKVHPRPWPGRVFHGSFLHRPVLDSNIL
jgi:hypothetical protein